ncbi:acyltransferase [Priestia megaterium]
MIKKIKNRVSQYSRDVFINSIAASNFTPLALRRFLYQSYGINTQTRSIRPGCYFGGKNVTIGKRTTINGKCYFENLASIKIGEDCDIAMGVLFCSSTHEFGDGSKRAGKAYGQPIKVGNGCWIGARATVLPGVTIHDGCIIAAGALVTKDCEPNGLYVGFPAKRVRDLTDLEKEKFAI